MIYSKENLRSIVRKFKANEPVQPDDTKQLVDFIYLMMEEHEDLVSDHQNLERRVKDLERKK